MQIRTSFLVIGIGAFAIGLICLVGCFTLLSDGVGSSSSMFGMMSGVWCFLGVLAIRTGGALQQLHDRIEELKK